MSELAFVISADRGTMQDEKTGRDINWMNFHYLTDYREADDNSVGLKPIKTGCTPEVFEVFRVHGIGLYKLDFKTRPGAGGKPAIALVKADCVGKIDLFELGNYRRQAAPGAPAAPAQAKAA
ncbi:hypothetical protein KJ910_02820 [Patescibacteria group bacterium]|nr:hypothetical protein [Patescibacteria group bacterium]